MVALLPATPVTLAAGRPNIVLIMADDMGWSDLGCYGGEIRTPHIDRLAVGGLRFTQFYNKAICGPTRASLLTGLYPQQVGHSGERWNEPKDFTRCVTIAELLQAAGYRTIRASRRTPCERRNELESMPFLQWQPEISSLVSVAVARILGDRLVSTVVG